MRNVLKVRRRAIGVCVVLIGLAGGVNWAGSQANSQYLHFPGPTVSYVEMPHNAALMPTSAITIELWVKLTSFTPSGLGTQECISLVGKSYSNGYWLGVCDGRLRFYHNISTNINSTALLTLGQWQHLAVTFDSTTVKFYIDGHEVSSMNSPGLVGTSSSVLRIGSDVGWNYSPVGDIDEVRLWNTARSAAQIHDNMRAPITAAQTGLVSVWHMDGNANDSIGGNNGTVVGNATFIGGSEPVCTYNYFVPTAGHIPGSGGVLWATDVTILNKSEELATVLVYELKRDVANTNPDFFAEELSAGESKVFSDIILNRFLSTNQASALRVCSNKELVVASKTYATSLAGTYGYGTSGPPVGQALAPGQAKWLLGVTETTAFRTNVGFVNTTATPAVITVSVYNSSGTLIHSPLAYDLAGFGHIQRGKFLRDAGAEGLSNCSVKIQVMGSPIFVYSTVADNGNGDGTYYLAE